MSSAPPVLLFGETESLLLFGEVVDRTLEVLTAQHSPKHRASGLQDPAGAERSYRNGIVADAVDECADRGYRVEIVACDAQRAPIHRAGGSRVALELVIPDMVEGLDNRGVLQPLHDESRSEAVI
jgi:hypothetical protein